MNRRTILHLFTVGALAVHGSGAWANFVDQQQAQQTSEYMLYQQQINALSPEERACVFERAQARQMGAQRKRGLSRLLSAISRTAVRTDHIPLAQNANDATLALVTVDDLQSAARDLGVVPDDLTACQK